MEMVKIIGVGLVGAVAALIVKEYKPQMAVPIGIATAVLLFFMILSQVGYVVDIITMTAARLNLNMEYITAILRMIAVAYLSQFGAEICRDAGQNAIAAKIELAGKVLIVVLSIPVLLALMNLLIGLLP